MVSVLDAYTSPDFIKEDITFTFGKIYNNNSFDARDTKEETCRTYYKDAMNINIFISISNECIIQLIKSSKTKPCQVSKLCTTYITDDVFYNPGYIRTHRLLFLQIGEKLQCQWNSRWVRKKIEQYCSEIYQEAVYIYDNCMYVIEMNDLLIEQILFCGREGFAEFMKREWLEYILSIQAKEGCFLSLEKFTNYKLPEKELRRRRRTADLIKFNCINHTTGLAAAVLSLFLRYLKSNILLTNN